MLFSVFFRLDLSEISGKSETTNILILNSTKTNVVFQIKMHFWADDAEGTIPSKSRCPIPHASRCATLKRLCSIKKLVARLASLLRSPAPFCKLKTWILSSCLHHMCKRIPNNSYRILVFLHRFRFLEWSFGAVMYPGERKIVTQGISNVGEDINTPV